MDSSGKSDNEGWSEFLFVSDTNSVGFEISETKIDERHLCKALHKRRATLCASALVRSVLFFHETCALRHHLREEHTEAVLHGCSGTKQWNLVFAIHGPQRSKVSHNMITTVCGLASGPVCCAKSSRSSCDLLGQILSASTMLKM